MVARGYGAMSLSRGEVSWANIFSIAKQQYSYEYKFGYYIEVTLYVKLGLLLYMMIKRLGIYYF